MRELLTDKETAKILQLIGGTRKLYKIVDFFDSDPEDEWELSEGEHFEYAEKSGEKRKRLFYEEGVEALAEYVDKDTPGIIKLVSEVLTHKRRRRKQRLVSRRITQELIESGSLVEMRGNLGFVKRKTCINILQTNGKGMNYSINRLKKAGSLEGQEALELEKHFLKTDEGDIIWSQKGIASIAIDMQNNSTVNKSRKAWISAVGAVVEDCFKAEIKRINAAPQRITKAIASAKSHGGHRCQITGKKQTRGNNLKLDGHHLFDRATRPDLADLLDNILVIEEEIHTQFHIWKGSGSCEPKDFLYYASEVRLDLFDSSNAKAMERFNKLTIRLTNLQKNYENYHLRYR